VRAAASFRAKSTSLEAVPDTRLQQHWLAPGAINRDWDALKC
jgi:hypothetical protein